MKSKRTVNTVLLAEYRTYPCLINNDDCKGDTCGHHLKTKGSGGNDEYRNLMALCRMHHSEVHQVGLTTFVKKYDLQNYMIDKEWSYGSLLNKWILRSR